MRQLRTLAHLVRADFLERTRRYSFLITLGAMLYVGYTAVPPVESDMLTVNLGNLRGIYNSAWIGGIVALLAALLLSLPGFYLVKNAISRDRETGVGQIIATTPLGKVLYMLGKLVSNFVYLAAISGLMMIAAGGMQLLRGEVLRLQLWDLIAPWLFGALPALAVVGAVALLFESLPFLAGGFGNIAYFALWTATLIVSLNNADFSAQGVITNPYNDLFGTTVLGASMLETAHAAYPNRDLEFGIGYAQVEGPIATFRWEGVTWTPQLVLRRFVWIGVAIGIALVAARLFDRFDPARGKPRRVGEDARRRWWHVRRYLPHLQLPRFRLPPLPLPGSVRLLVAELRLSLRGQRWWWYVVALSLIVAGFTATDAEALHIVWLLAWLWPVLIWSNLGVREHRYHTASIVFSSPRPLRRQLVATWLVGVLVAVIMGSGAGLRFLLAGQPIQCLAWGVGALFIPTLALAAGIWSGGSKLFEALYVTAWYIGPLNGFVQADFAGANPATLAAGMPWIYLGATVLLLVLMVLGRARQIRA